MISNKTLIQYKIGDRSYDLYVSPESPLGELYDAISVMKSMVYQKIRETHDKEMPKTESSQESVVVVS